MPHSPPKLCAACGNIHAGRGCRAIQAAYEAQRGNSTERGYDSRWAAYSRSFRKRYPLCGDSPQGPRTQHSACVRERRITPATVVDHIVPWRGDYALKWDPRNHQSLCDQCHSIKTEKEDGRWADRGSQMF